MGNRLGLSVILIMLVFILYSCGGKFACKETLGGVKCEPLSEVYQEQVINRSEKQSEESGAKGEHGKEHDDDKEKKGKVREQAGGNNNSEIVKKLEAEGRHPLRIPPRVVAVWIAPWEDSDGDLHEQEFIFMEIIAKEGKWVLGEKIVDTRGSKHLKKIDDITPPGPETTSKQKSKDDIPPSRDKQSQGKSKTENRDFPVVPGRKDPVLIK